MVLSLVERGSVVQFTDLGLECSYLYDRTSSKGHGIGIATSLHMGWWYPLAPRPALQLLQE